MSGSLLQISDPHFGTERAPVVEALLRFARAQSPELVVLSGDITQRATRDQFARAAHFAARLAAPALLAIAGNHDLPLYNLAARLLDPYGRQRRAFGSELQPHYASPGWLVIALNTTRPWRHKHGVLSAAQIEATAERLAAAAPGQLRVVVVHQPLAVTRAEDERHLLRGHARAARRWAEAGCDLVLGGHIHLPFVVALHDRHAGLARRVWVAQAGTAVSSRVRGDAGNSVHLVRPLDTAGARACVIERWDYAEGSERFEHVASHALACDAATAGGPP